MTSPVPVAVFASGGGTNLQALLDYESEDAAYRIEVVVSDRPDAGALERARVAGRDAVVIPTKDRRPDEVANDTLACLRSAGIEMILLAGYLRLVPPDVVRAYPRRVLNIHPALLPAFGGKGMWGIRVHQAVLDAGAEVSGPSVHFVDEAYDTGSILAQWRVPVHPDDTAEALAASVLRVEHVLYPMVADRLARSLVEGIEFPRVHCQSEPVTELSDEELVRAIRASFQMGEPTA